MKTTSKDCRVGTKCFYIMRTITLDSFKNYNRIDTTTRALTTNELSYWTSNCATWSISMNRWSLNKLVSNEMLPLPLRQRQYVYHFQSSKQYT